MDRTRNKTNKLRLARPTIIAAALITMVGGGVILASIDFRTRRVDRQRLTIETVQTGTMEVKVGANGQLVSNAVAELAAQVPGRVAKADIKPGALVKAGQVLVELENPQLMASAEEAQSAWEGAVAEHRSAQAELQTNILNEQAALTKAGFELEKARLKTESDEALSQAGLLSGIELKRSRLDLSQMQKSYEIGASRLKTLQDNVQVQLAVRKSRITQLARALDRARSQSADLHVTAGISGIVQAISVEVGQQLTPGSPIGRVAQQDRLYAELKVPAREATQIQPSQHVLVDTRNGTVDGVVSRVDPSVTDGTVVVDVDLPGALPPGARPQLPVEGTIYISRLPNAVYVGKPAYVKNDSTISVYKLDSAGRYATRVNVRTGKVSLNYLQVLQGLQPGDRIITSETGEWQSEDRILLK